MESEKLKIKLGVSGTFWDRRPEYRVTFNGAPIACQHFQAESGATEMIEFTADYSQETAAITVELLNKRPTDTVENADKTGILQDMVLDVVSLEIDDIDLGPLLHSVGEYRPVYPDHYSGDPVIRGGVTLGWNGTWSISWTNPFYIWLLENL